MGEENRLLRRAEGKKKSRKRQRGPYRKSSLGGRLQRIK